MSSLLSISNQLVILITLLVVFGCGGEKNIPDPKVTYYIHAEDWDSSKDSKSADYMRKHMQGRTKVHLLTNNASACDMEVTLHIGDDFGGDYSVKYEDGKCHLSAKTERTMTWLLYQFIKHDDMVALSIHKARGNHPW